jgi:hypothetical protein
MNAAVTSASPSYHHRTLGTHQHAMLAVRAVMVEYPDCLLLFIHQDGVVGAGPETFEAEYAFLLMPGNASFKSVDLCPVGRRYHTHGDILDGSAEPAGAVPFEVRQVEKEITCQRLAGKLHRVKCFEPYVLFHARLACLAE